MAIQTQIDRINNAVNTQTDLIAQIQTALQGKAAGGGSGSGSSAPTIADFTYTEEVGDEPGMYNYTLSSSSLQSSTRYVITIFTRDTNGFSVVWKTLYRSSRSNDFIVCDGSVTYVSAGMMLTLDEDTVTIKGAAPRGSRFNDFWFIAT